MARLFFSTPIGYRFLSLSGQPAGLGLGRRSLSFHFVQSERLKLVCPIAQFSRVDCLDKQLSWRGYATVTERKSKGDGEKAKSPKPALLALKFLTKLYDLLTLPVYYLIQQPGKAVALHNRITGIKVPGKYEWRAGLPRSVKSNEIIENKIDTLEKLFEHKMTQNGAKPCLGTRPIISQESIQYAGQTIQKRELGDYQWKSFGEVKTITRQLSSSLTHVLNLKPRETIAVFADTREEWLMTAIAAFKSNLAIATVFTTLGDDGVVHALNETEVNCLFTSDDLMPRCYKLLKETPSIKTVVYMDRFDPNNPFQVDPSQMPEGVKVLSLSSLLKATQENLPLPPRPLADDTAIIMYTSGSTGVPKGVILTHFNAINVLMGMADALDSLAEERDDECYLAVLPLAHILELTSEANTFLHNARIAYGTPFTLTDASPGIKEGTKGDATASRPTVLAVVPLVLERISKTVQAKLDAAGGIVPDIFNFFCTYKAAWIRKGYKTPLLDKLFFKKIRDVIGGNVRVVVVGGAPLAPQTEELVRTMLCCPIVVGYGLTETSGCASCCVAEDLSVGRSGSPIHSCTFRLVDWEEGGYKVTDLPYPRGELYIGGDSVAKSYFKRESEDFFTENGKRWLKSGDICEIHDDGVIKIIDRKKDLVKLASGEFISLGKIESVLKTSQYVDNVCVCANSTLTTPIAIIVPPQVQIEKLAKNLKIGGKSFEELARDPQIVENFLHQIQEHCRAHKLTKWEIPSGIHLSPTVWTPHSGLVTSSLKLKRANIHSHFKQEIQQLQQK